MNTSDRLNPEERELARLLGRPSATLAPNARIDAAIAEMAQQPLAAPASTTQAQAQARVSAPPVAASRTTARHGRRRRLMPALAVAASLVLVIGLAWQLQPTLPPMEAHQVASDAPPPAEPAAMPQPAPLPAAESADTPAKPVARMDHPPSQIREAAPPASRARMATADAPAKPATSTASEPQQITVTGSRMAKAIAANDGLQRAREVAPPSPPAPPAPPAQVMAAPPPPPQVAIRLPAPASAEAALAAAPARDSSIVPDLETDTALPPRQWLQRIRQRHTDGDDAGARASLRQLIATHPKTRIPRDLRPLLED